jgi:phenylalanyl-tRNA synthetase alpha chain
MIDKLLAELDKIESDVRERLAQIESMDLVEALRIEYMARKGTLTGIMRSIGEIDPADRPRFGARAGAVKKLLTEGLEQAKARLKSEDQGDGEFLDITLPGRTPALGRAHPLTIALDQALGIFAEMGFSVAEGPEIEHDYYNFEALNFPPDHPARDMQDTYFLEEEGWLLRTHTSPTQIREMEKREPPLRVVMPGRVYRNEEINVRSHNQFFQVEGLYVDEDVTFADLKGTIITFCRRFFGSSTDVRFRPSFFPFTEPSAEVDVSCYMCGGKGCRICKHTGWLEIMGAGMVDPALYSFVGYDPDKVSGFAFGMGIDRTTMNRYGVDDIRRFFENHMWFLRQFER